MTTRGFLEKFSLLLRRNEWVLYVSIATFYNLKQQRAFPRPKEIYLVFPISRYARSEAMRTLVEAGLVEIWRGPNGRCFVGYDVNHIDLFCGHLETPNRWPCAS